MPGEASSSYNPGFAIHSVEDLESIGLFCDFIHGSLPLNIHPPGIKVYAWLMLHDLPAFTGHPSGFGETGTASGGAQASQCSRTQGQAPLILILEGPQQFSRGPGIGRQTKAGLLLLHRSPGFCPEDAINPAHVMATGRQLFLQELHLLH